MAITSLTFYLLLFIPLLSITLHTPTPTPTAAATTTTTHYSSSTLFSDYQKMLKYFKIFIYPPQQTNNINPFNNFTTTATPSPLSIFFTSLLKAPSFLTDNPNQAHLFFLPFSPQPTRSLARVINHIRTSFPFWNRSLGADHFFLSCNGVGPTSSRNVVELKKNAVQVTCFPSPAGDFIPHKDLTLPPKSNFPLSGASGEISPSPTRFLGYWRFGTVGSGSDLIGGLRGDRDFLIESGTSDERGYVDGLQSSKFCLFFHEGDEVVGLGAALVHGCVPVVITDRPIQDLPLMDVIRWSENALFVRSNVGPKELKRVLKRTCEGDGGVYERMRRSGVAVAQHLVWNDSPQPYDAFHMVMYQLWTRRHAIRYARWEMDVASA